MIQIIDSTLKELKSSDSNRGFEQVAINIIKMKKTVHETIIKDFIIFKYLSTFAKQSQTNIIAALNLIENNLADMKKSPLGALVEYGERIDSISNELDRLNATLSYTKTSLSINLLTKAKIKLLEKQLRDTIDKSAKLITKNSKSTDISSIFTSNEALTNHDRKVIDHIFKINKSKII
jgi:hypothetical protein